MEEKEEYGNFDTGVRAHGISAPANPVTRTTAASAFQLSHGDTRATRTRGRLAHESDVSAAGIGDLGHANDRAARRTGSRHPGLEDARPLRVSPRLLH